MKSPSLLLLAAVLASTPAVAAGQFDSYTLALSWEPAFCESKPSASECASESPGRFDAANLILHGLWPDRSGGAGREVGYCGVDAATREFDRSAAWCRLPEPALSEATRAELAEAMPGATSCLDRHEWTKHGTCSGMTADDYFARASALVSAVSKTAFGRYLSASAGRTVELEGALAAFEADFGPGSRDKLSLRCAQAGGKTALIEARLRLTNPLGPPSELKTMLLPTGDRGDCPPSFLLDSAPARR